MKILFYPTLGLFALLILSACQQPNVSDATDRQAIDAYVAKIDNDRQSYMRCEKNEAKITEKTTSIISYYDDGSLIKLVVTYKRIDKRKMNKTDKEMYIKERNIFYIQELDQEYEIKEPTNDFHAGQSEIVSETLSQFYFKNKKLAYWIKNGELIDKNSPEYSLKAKQWLDEYANLSINDLINSQGCPKEDSTITFNSPKPKYNSVEIDQCLALQKTSPSEQFGLLSEDFNSQGRTGWYPISEIGNEEKIYTGFSRWIGESAQDVVLENDSPSGDWYRIDDYCFKKGGTIVSLRSNLRTFYGDVQVIRTWMYKPDGSTASDDIEVIDMNTDLSIDPKTASYMDNPPILVKNYQDLLKKLEMPTSLIK